MGQGGPSRRHQGRVSRSAAIDLERRADQGSPSMSALLRASRDLTHETASCQIRILGTLGRALR